MNLVPFSPESLLVEAKLEAQSSGFLLSFRVTGEKSEIAKVVLPEKNIKPCRTDELWKKTCFECFFAMGGSDAYVEFNGSPSGDWALYSFEGYRQGMKPLVPESNEFPEMEKMDRTETEISCTWKIPSFTSQFIRRAGLTAVIVIRENDQERISYWALSHAGEIRRRSPGLRSRSSDCSALAWCCPVRPSCCCPRHCSRQWSARAK